ncbi:MEDS domain-containing protein [Yinghuangia seranimata]|uniref:MEDS domain-containing protein n=1 Tax=Yinghuangia seranimata TaxID=408067 RepID=UPI00248D16A4|nr:MEDS domain-containing protein [Yinghuangia seranimata]MDI2125733.1 MEDS domain-containing protein [Yinghuangia seranimata]
MPERPESSTTGSEIPVQRMRPGDHAFVSYGDDEGRWDVLTAFTWLGLAGGERVIVFADPGVPRDDVLARLGADSPELADALGRGQLVLSSMRELIQPERNFTATRQQARLVEETDRAVGDGYRALRAYIDMHWVPALGTDVSAMIDRETHADHLFTDRPYSEICAYDRRWFDDAVLEAMRRAHPCNLLEYVGALHAEHTSGVVRFAGEADLATRERFTAAVAVAMAAARGHALTVDLTHLHFLSAGCAGDLLRAAAAVSGPARVDIRCSPFQAGLLRNLGARETVRLVLSETGAGC